MKIGEQTYPICPEEEITRAGFVVRKVPDDQNAAIEYLKAINLYVKPEEDLSDVYNSVLRGTWSEEAEKLIPWLEKNAAAIAAVRAGSQKDDCRFPFLKKPGESFVNMLLPHLSDMRELGRLLVIQGERFEYQKRYREALDTYLAVARTGFHVSKEPILISCLVGVALDAMAVKGIEGCILRNRLDTEILVYLSRQLGVIGRVAESYEVGLAGERVFGTSVVDDLFDRPRELSFKDIAGKGSELYNFVPVIGRRVPGLRAIMKSDFRRFWSRMDEWNKLPAHIALRPENSPDKIIDELSPWSLARMLVPAVARTRAVFLAAKARKEVLATEIALQIYWNVKRDYPDNLNQLKGILDEIPPDPFATEPLRYRRTKDGWIVYSVGENLVDDGGVKGEKGAKKDIVGCFPVPESSD